VDLGKLDNVNLQGGSPQLVALDGDHADGAALTYTVSSSDPSLVSWSLTDANNPSLKMTVQGYGVMVFELLKDMAPRPATQVETLASEGFYDNRKIYRIDDNFVFQFGDQNATPSRLGTFSDQFNDDLQHNRGGLLSYAKGGDDTNDSELFATLAATRWLDFNHSIFGVLIEGEDVLRAIEAVEVHDGTDTPKEAPVITSMEVFTSQQNGTLLLKAPEGASGQADVTVTAKDAQGNETTQTFRVTVTPDDWDGGPYLNDIGDMEMPADTSMDFQLTANDVEGDAVKYFATKQGPVDYTLDVNADTGEVTVTPPPGYVGPLKLTVGVQAADASSPKKTADPTDTESITINVLSATPVLDLLSESDSNIDDDNVTNKAQVKFRVSDVIAGSTVRLYADGTLIGQGTAAGDFIDITTNNLSAIGDGTYSVTATQAVGGVESPRRTRWW
jgi:cyclophilin family peptidyl-prolyl cis-trans isomerase